MIPSQSSSQEDKMTKLGRVIPIVAICSIVVFLLAAIASAQSPSAADSKAASKAHHLILQVNTNDPATMNLALNNAANVEQYYRDLNEKVEIEIVAFGPGLHMLREDTSPVKDRIKSLAATMQGISFKACGNTQENMSRAESKKIALIPQATVVESGVVRVIELQEQGWSYVRP
jgi:intracellular sulfur oxidation DsrE/DsrF family protein